MTTETTITPTLLAAALLLGTGEDWAVGKDNTASRGSFTVVRVRDGLPLSVRAEGASWRVTLDLSPAGKWEGDRLPYYVDKAKAERDGQPWGKVRTATGSYTYAGGGVNISQTKTLEQVTREIIRRSLPMVSPAWAWVSASIAKSNAYHTKASALADELGSIIGVPATNRENDHRIDLTRSSSKMYGEIEVYGDSVTINIRSATPDQARAVLRALAGTLK